MNKKQWNVLSIASTLFAMLFMGISLQWKNMCSTLITQKLQNYACMRGEIFAPYPYIFFGLVIVFIICSSLENKK